MELLKKSLGIKIGLFILMQILIVITLLAGMVVFENLGREWYSRSSRDVEQDILRDTAFTASGRIADRLYGEPWREGEELVYGEKASSGFGYFVYLGEDIEIFGVRGEEGETITEFRREVSKEESCYREKDDHGAYVIEVYLNPKNGTFPKMVEEHYQWLRSMYKYRSQALYGGLASGAAASFILILLLITAGCRKKDEDTFLNKLPMDLLAAVGFTLITCTGLSISDMMEGELIGVQLAIWTIAALVISASITGFLVLFACQAKQSGWWKHMILYRLWRLLFRIGKSAAAFTGRSACSIVKKFPLVWRTVFALLIIWLLNLLFAVNMYYDGTATFFWLVEAVAVSAGVIHIALSLRRLQEGGRRLAEGDLNYKIDTEGLHLDFAEHAENLNSIGNGMSKAVEERLKSERFKAELITNVSHDIKTPLTSIINYVDFLKQEDLGSEKAKEYLEVLDRQSSRLKKLTEDLVDASKAATGNIKMNLVPCQIGILMSQTMGEYEEKAKASDLHFIMKLPEEDLEILADGRRLWRVLDNLLNNICKYAQPGSRVYMDLEKQDGKAVITYKNMSRYELNITEEELMERFVRGDSSRHTEGSGLGLSIAQNLVGLQNGTFRIKIDGDLFKVVMEFPLITL